MGANNPQSSGDLIAKLHDLNASDVLADGTTSNPRNFKRSGLTARLEINSTAQLPIERLTLETKAVVFDLSGDKPVRFDFDADGNSVPGRSAIEVLKASSGGKIQVRPDYAAYKGGNSIPVTVRFNVDNATKGGAFVVQCFGSISVKSAIRGLSGTSGRGSSRTESINALI